jgi:hypothetical protein
MKEESACDWLGDGASARLQAPKMSKDELWWADEIFIA